MTELALGIDFDGVITDPTILKQSWILDNCSISIKPEETAQKKAVAIIGKKRYEEMIEVIYSGSRALENQLRAGAREEMGKLMSHGYSPHIVTSRYDHERVVAEELLSRWQVPHVSLRNNNEQSKAAICRELGVRVFLDDTPSKLIELRDIPDLILVYFNVFHEEVAPGLHSVANWEEFVNLVRTEAKA